MNKKKREREKDMARIKGMSGTYLILSFVVVVVVDRLQSLLKEKKNK